MPSTTLPLPRKHSLANRIAIARHAYANRYHPTGGVTVCPSARRTRGDVQRHIELRFYIAQRRFHAAVRDIANAMHIAPNAAATLLRHRLRAGHPLPRLARV